MPGRVNGRENSGGSGLPEENKLICGLEEEIVVAHGRLTSPALPVGWPVPINSYNTCSTFCTSFFLKGTESVILMDPPCKDDNAKFRTVPMKPFAGQKCGDIIVFSVSTFCRERTMIKNNLIYA